jgi:hypothetical protein
MGKIRWIIASLAALDILIGTGHAFAQRNEMPAGYPQSLEPALQAGCWAGWAILRLGCWSGLRKPILIWPTTC